MDIDRAFAAPFRDPAWLEKTAWAGLWSGLVVTSPALAGYLLDYTRGVANGDDVPMPEWNRDFGRWWVRGFLLMLAGFIYVLPALLLVAAGVVPLLAGLVAAGVWSRSGTVAAALLGTGTVCLTGVIALIYLLALSVFFPAARTNFAFSEDFGALFRIGEILARLRTVGSGYFVAWGMSIAAALAAATVGGVLASILGGTVVLAIASPFVTGAIGFLAGAITAHLFGQYAAKAYGLSGPRPDAAHVPAAGVPSAAAPTRTSPSPATGTTTPASSDISVPVPPMSSCPSGQVTPPSYPGSDPPAEGDDGVVPVR